MRIDLEKTMKSYKAAQAVANLNSAPGFKSNNLAAYLFQIDYNQDEVNGKYPVVGATVGDGDWAISSGDAFANAYRGRFDGSINITMLSELVQDRTDERLIENTTFEIDNELIDIIEEFSQIMESLCDSSYYGVITFNAPLAGNHIIVFHVDAALFEDLEISIYKVKK